MPKGTAIKKKGPFWNPLTFYELGTVGVKVRNMKMDFNTGGTRRRVGQWTLMMKIYDFFYSAKSFNHHPV